MPENNSPEFIEQSNTSDLRKEQRKSSEEIKQEVDQAFIHRRIIDIKRPDLPQAEMNEEAIQEIDTILEDQKDKPLDEIFIDGYKPEESEVTVNTFDEYKDLLLLAQMRIMQTEGFTEKDLESGYERRDIDNWVNRILKHESEHFNVLAGKEGVKPLYGVRFQQLNNVPGVPLQALPFVNFTGRINLRTFIESLQAVDEKSHLDLAMVEEIESHKQE